VAATPGIGPRDFERVNTLARSWNDMNLFLGFNQGKYSPDLEKLIAYDLCKVLKPTTPSHSGKK
jgi:hypothetical protein